MVPTTPPASTHGDIVIEGVPQIGEVLWCNIGPVKGTEQDGYRPFIVLSHPLHNEISGRVTGVSVTSTTRGWETEIPLSCMSKPCVAQIDQLRTIDIRGRGAKFRGEVVAPAELDAVKNAIRAFLQL